MECKNMPQTKIDVREFLKRLPLFSDAMPEELAVIADATTELHLQRGETVFRRGDPCMGFHMVIYGQVKLGFNSAQGDEKIIEIVGPSQSFGEALMFMDRPYIVNATVLADCLLLHVAKEAVYTALDANPGFARRMLAGMSRRLHGLISDVEAYSLRSASQRIAGYLLKEAEAQGDSKLNLAASKKAIASRLSLTPEHFSRVLHDLADDGLIAVEGRLIHILDAERLKRLQ